MAACKFLREIKRKQWVQILWSAGPERPGGNGHAKTVQPRSDYRGSGYKGSIIRYKKGPSISYIGSNFADFFLKSLAVMYNGFRAKKSILFLSFRRNSRIF